MWLRVVGSADALRRVGAATGVQWDVSEELPLGTPEQLERLQRLLGLEQQGFTLHLVRDHMRAEVLSLGQTPWQLGLTADVDVWVEPASPKPNNASSPSAATAAVAVHPTLEAFHRPNLLFIRFVKVLTDREQEEMRVLVLSTKSLYLAHNNTAIDRWILYNEVREAVVMTEPDGDWVLLRCIQPEHDILLCLIDHHNNIPVHTTGDKLSMVLHHSGVKITPWQRSLEELYGLAHLHLHRGYVDVARKCEMIRNSPLNPSAYASSPPLHPRLDQQPPHDSLQPSVATASPPRDSVKAVPDPPQEPEVLHMLKEQTEMLGVLREEFQALQRRQTEAAKTEESGHIRQLADEVAAMKAQNAELAKHVIVSSTMVGGSPPPQHAAAPSPPPQAQPSSGLSKAVVVGVSHGTELPGNTRSAEQALAFLRGVGSAQVEVLSDSPVGGVPCNPPTRDNVVAALRWLAEGAAPGQSLWLSLALQARAGAWLTGDGLTLHPAELQSLLFAALPGGVRLTVMLDGVPAISVMNWSTTGLDLPYCLVCTEGAVSKEEADRKGAPSVHAQVVLLSALQQPKAGVGPSQGQLAGLLSSVFLSELGGARPVNYEQLLQAVAQPVRDVSQGAYLPIVASSFSLSKHTPVSVVPVQVDQPPQQPARVVPGFEPSPPAPAAAFAPATLAVPQQLPRSSPPRFPAVPQFSAVEGQPAYNTATTTSPLHSASQPPEIKVPLMAPFVDMDAPVTSVPPVQQEQVCTSRTCAHAHTHLLRTKTTGETSCVTRSK